MKIPGTAFSEFLSGAVFRQQLEQDCVAQTNCARGPVYRELWKHYRNLDGKHTTEALLCFPLLMEKRYAINWVKQVSRNLQAFARELELKDVRVHVLTENLIDVDGKPVDNELRNKVGILVTGTKGA